MSTVEPSIISFFVESFKEINMKLTTDPGQAIKDILKIMCNVNPAKHETVKDYHEIIKDGETYENEVNGIYSPMQDALTVKIYDYHMRHTREYRRLYQRALAVFWKCDYFNYATFMSFYDPSGGRKSGS